MLYPVFFHDVLGCIGHNGPATSTIILRLPDPLTLSIRERPERLFKLETTAVRSVQISLRNFQFFRNQRVKTSSRRADGGSSSGLGKMIVVQLPLLLRIWLTFSLRRPYFVPLRIANSSPPRMERREYLFWLRNDDFNE
ncbi:hypothetical protein AVEN_145545-1 [Araneus ventricosus]|uniref:Uncharacterized protein n=1 Tax=Araneus ventricosus TaxID=182803 RepID=A0A4Y2PIK4_ARAVE|nr:hypothetical protein AVEN_145545-1 [Araneus ventricosus]